MGLRQRNGFDGVNAVREDLNLTKYDEKYVYSTDRDSGAQQSPLFPPAAAHSAAPDEDEHNYVFGRTQPQPDARASVFGRTQPQQQPAGYDRQFAAEQQPEERPMVFVLREDRDMYVYEYSNRLEYYRRTETGMVHCATRPKAVKF